VTTLLSKASTEKASVSFSQLLRSPSRGEAASSSSISLRIGEECDSSAKSTREVEERDDSEEDEVVEEGDEVVEEEQEDVEEGDESVEEDDEAIEKEESVENDGAVAVALAVEVAARAEAVDGVNAGRVESEEEESDIMSY